MNRRSILTGLVGLVTAPAVLRLGVHMPVRTVERKMEALFNHRVGWIRDRPSALDRWLVQYEIGPGVIITSGGLVYPDAMSALRLDRIYNLIG